MATGVTSWSQTAATNAGADATITWAEGQAPSSVNDSARALMASVAKYRDDNAGSLVTGGTTTAYTLSSNQGFASFSAMNGASLRVRFNATNGAAPTLNVDGLGAKAIQTASGTAVATGAILANSVHDLTYDNSIPAWLLGSSFASQPLDATLTAFAALGIAADKLPYGSGSDAFTLLDFPSAARTLVSQSSQSAMRSTGLGLGTSAVKDTGTSGDAVALLNADNTHSGNNTHSGTNTFNNAAGVTARNSAKAFVIITTDGSGNPSIVSHFNITSIATATVGGQNGFRLTFDTDLSSANYAAHIRATDNSSISTTLYIGSRYADQAPTHLDFVVFSVGFGALRANLHIVITVFENSV